VRVGILALQGDVLEHASALESLGAEAYEVRRPPDLVGLSGIILPGGESTTLSILLESSGLFEPLGSAIRTGLPTLATCAGLVLMATEVLDGRADQRSFGMLHCTVRRNGYGRQAHSFETGVDAAKLNAELGVEDTALPTVFIRAPVIESVGAEVEVLATLQSATGADPEPVVCRHSHVLAATFHPELTEDRRVHQLFLQRCKD
jgi:pyridoxal 5'-phosphate synthase pdxT subunit